MINIRKIVLFSALLLSASSITAPMYAIGDDEQSILAPRVTHAKIPYELTPDMISDIKQHGSFLAAAKEYVLQNPENLEYFADCLNFDATYCPFYHHQSSYTDYSELLTYYIEEFGDACFPNPNFDPERPEETGPEWIGEQYSRELSRLIFKKQDPAPAKPLAVAPIVEEQESESIAASSMQAPSSVNPSNKIDSAFKVYAEENEIKITADTDFHFEYNADRNVWIGMERITPENIGWWRGRLGHEAYMQYGQEVEFQRRIAMERTEEQQVADEAYAQTMRSLGHPYSSSFEHEAIEFFSMMSNMPYEEQYYRLFEKQSVAVSGDDYLDPWRAFRYNLDHSGASPAWVAYASSEPVENPLYKSMSVVSPAVKLAMTVKVSKHFYTPFGIFSSPIGQAFDRESGTEKYKQLSMPVHAAVARFVSKITDVKYMVVRPLKSMAGILKKSGLEFSESKGPAQDISFPYIRCTLDHDRRWYSEPDVLTAEEKESFGDSQFILVDPRAKELHRIRSDHWFATHPFSGGVSRKLIEAFPFLTVDVKSLGNL